MGGYSQHNQVCAPNSNQPTLHLHCVQLYTVHCTLAPKHDTPALCSSVYFNTYTVHTTPNITMCVCAPNSDPPTLHFATVQRTPALKTLHLNNSALDFNTTYSSPALQCTFGERAQQWSSRSCLSPPTCGEASHKRTSNRSDILL